MKTLKTVVVTPVFSPDYLPLKEDMEFGKIYISKLYGGSSHLCLCGCGEHVYIPINNPGDWQLTEPAPGVITIAPSLLHRFECRSHYIITNNKANFV